jgi:hypothetical protein
LAISVRTSNTTRSMLRLVARSPRGAHRAGKLDNAVSVTSDLVDQFIDIALAHQSARHRSKRDAGRGRGRAARCRRV